MESTIPQVGDLIIQSKTPNYCHLVGLVLCVNKDRSGYSVKYLKLGDNKVYSTQWRVWSDKYWTIVPGSP